MTLLREIQMLLERTYAPTGINLEECLVGQERFRELSILAGPTAAELSREARTFLRIQDGRLYLAIYYHPAIIAALERQHPLRILSADNIHPLIVFLEEVTHAIHASLLFLEKRLRLGAETLLCDLELQAKVDTYLALKLIGTVLRKRHRLAHKHKDWLRRCLFGQESFSYPSSQIRRRYREANRLGLRLVQHLDALPSAERMIYVRRFRKLSFAQKRSEILSLTIDPKVG